MMFPIIFSPGPGNVMVASSGSHYGVAKSLRLIAGLNTIILLMGLSIGLGLAEFFKKEPQVFLILRYAAVLYIAYLAYKFLRPALAPKQGDLEAVATLKLENGHSYWDGFLLQALNPKAWAMVITMFSAFSNTAMPILGQVLLLSFLLLFFNTINNFMWASAGSLIIKKYSSAHSVRMQNLFFGLTLLGVAIWMFLDLFGIGSGAAAGH